MNNALKNYIQDICKIPLINEEEEKILAEKRDNGDESAREKLIKSNLRLVVKIANDYSGMGTPLLDLISEGNIGLMRAAEKFDPEKGAKFSSYAAWWIKQGMRKALSGNSKIIRVPTGSAIKIKKIRNTRISLREKLNREPTDEEIAADLEFSEKTIHRLKLRDYKEVSLQDPILNGEEGTIEDLIAVECPYFKEMEDKEAFSRLTRLIEQLDPREKYIIIKRYGLDQEHYKTLEQISSKLGLTRERVRQIQMHTLKKLKEMIDDERFYEQIPRDIKISSEMFKEGEIPEYEFLNLEERVIVRLYNNGTPALESVATKICTTMAYAKVAEKRAFNKIDDFLKYKSKFEGKVISEKIEDMVYGILCTSNFDDAINLIEGDDKELLRMKYVEGKSYRDISEKLNKPPCKLKYIEKRGLKKICKKIGLS